MPAPVIKGSAINSDFSFPLSPSEGTPVLSRQFVRCYHVSDEHAIDQAKTSILDKSVSHVKQQMFLLGYGGELPKSFLDCPRTSARSFVFSDGRYVQKHSTCGSGYSSTISPLGLRCVSTSWKRCSCRQSELVLGGPSCSMSCCWTSQACGRFRLRRNHTSPNVPLPLRKDVTTAGHRPSSTFDVCQAIVNPLNCKKACHLNT